MDAYNARGWRPNGLTVWLYANGKKTEEKVWPCEGNGWRTAFEDLPLTDEAGLPIVYTVVAANIEGYYYTVKTLGVSGYLITFRLKDGPPATGDPGPLPYALLLSASGCALLLLRRRGKKTEIF